MAETEALQAANEFGLQLLRRLYAEREDDGVSGETFDAMGDALGLNGLMVAEANQAYKELMELLLRLDPSVEFRLANTSWLEEGFRIRRDYLGRVQEAFGARIESVRFEESDTANVINGWVAEGTGGRITDLVTPEEFAGLVALMVNTVYFQGQWTDPFDPAETAMVEFRRADGSTVTVPMMRQVIDARVGGGEDYGEDYVAVDLPYGGGAFSMMVVVPIGDGTLAQLVEEMDVLKAMGMEVAFDRFGADFGWILGNPEFLGVRAVPHLGWMKQKTFVKVDEEGTETAAATGTAFAVSGTSVLQADRPFLFAIRERLSGTILSWERCLTRRPCHSGSPRTERRGSAFRSHGTAVPYGGRARGSPSQVQPPIS